MDRDTDSDDTARCFLTTIGSDTNPLDANIFDGVTLWLGIAIDDGEELQPRSSITSVPYSTCSDIAVDVTGHIHPKTVAIDGIGEVIDSNGKWVGDLEGLKGEKGDRSDIGLEGPQGEIGETGPKGDQGEKGNPGDTGPIGPAGPSGCPHGVI